MEASSWWRPCKGICRTVINGSGRLAQLGEHFSYTEEVIGSSPISPIMDIREKMWRIATGFVEPGDMIVYACRRPMSHLPELKEINIGDCSEWRISQEREMIEELEILIPCVKWYIEKKKLVLALSCMQLAIATMLDISLAKWKSGF